MKEPNRPADICAHLGDDYDRYLGAIVPPVFQNTLFTRKHGSHGYSYSRINNPTVEILEKKLAALEHAPAARVFASGMAAITAANLGQNESTMAQHAAMRITRGSNTRVRASTPVFSPYVVLAGAPKSEARIVARPSPSSVRCKPGSAM